MKFIDSFRIVIQLGNCQGEDVFLGLCMCPGAYFSTIADEVNSVVLSSGTLNPIHQLSAELGTAFNVLLSAPHVIEPSQLKVYTVKEGNNGVKLCSSYSHLKDERNRVEIELGKCVIDLIRVIPGGVLFFVPSHQFLDSMVNTWQREGILDVIKGMKSFFHEQMDLSLELYVEYKRAIEKEGGAFLVGVFRGRMNEGIDF
jgi:Rad3-related DNA helicase